MNRLSGNLRGAIWMIASGLGFTVYLALAKLLSETYDPGFLAFSRAIIALGFTLPIILRRGQSIFETNRFGLVFLRSIFGTLGFIASLYAVSAQFDLPLSQFNAISFSRTLFVTVLAAVVLRERVGGHRWTATGVGFLGVLIMVRPDGGVDLGTALALFSALAFAGAIILVKTLSATHTPLTLLLWANLLSSLLLAPFAFSAAAWPDLHDWGIVFAMAVSGLAAQYCYITAMSIGDASFLSPMDYLRLPMTAAADWAVFRVLPGLSVWSGAAVIVAATLYITWRERRALPRPAAGA